MTIPQHSIEGAATLDVFFGSAVDLLIFFEDKDCEAIYDVLARKVLVGIDAKSLCLNGKDSVLKHSASEISYPRARRLYVLDKDFDDLLGLLVNRENLVYLKRYSVENYVVEPSAVVELAVEEYPKNRDVLTKKIDLDGYMRSLEGDLLNLVKAFFIVQREDLGLPNARQSCHHFSANTARHRLSVEKIRDYVGSVRQALLDRGVVATLGDADSMISYAFDDADLWNHVPGKLLSGFIYAYLAHEAGVSSIKSDSFTYRLAKSCTFDSLDFLRTKAKSLVDA